MNPIVGGGGASLNWLRPPTDNASDASDTSGAGNTNTATGYVDKPEATTLNVMEALLSDIDEASANIVSTRRLREADRKNWRSDDFERILDSDADEKLEELATLLNRGRSDSSTSEDLGNKFDLAMLLREANERFSDPSDLLLALRELRRRSRLSGEPVDEVERALDELMQEGESKRTKAGINAALKAKVFGAELKLDPRQLRELYRSFLEFEGSFFIVYEDWIEQFGWKKRKRILEYVSAALTYDMQSLDPSCRCSTEFGPLLRMLQDARLLSSADERFVTHLCVDALASDCGMTEERALAVMLGGLQRPFALEEVLHKTLSNVFVPLAALRRSQLLQLILAAFARVPTSIYTELEDRHAVLEALERLIEITYASERRQARPHADSVW